MTQIVARLVLAMLILPSTGAVFLLAAFVMIRGNGPPSLAAIGTIWGLVYLFVAAYWTLLWRGLVKWTGRRVALTAGAGLFALGVGLGVATLISTLNFRVPVQITLLVGGGTVPIVWVLGTVMLWTETRAERSERLKGLGARSVTCPICGYSMIGLREARCPECGASFTLEHLLAAQAESPEPE